MRKTLRGQLEGRELRRLLIDDGDFQHGFIVEEFHISPVNPLDEANSTATAAILHIDNQRRPQFDWSRPQQIGWAVFNTNPTNLFSLIDPDHIVVRELYITNVNVVQPLNYMIIIRDRSMTPAQGVLQMVKEVTYND